MNVTVVRSSAVKDRLDPEFYDPRYLELERRLRMAGAVELSTLAEVISKRANPSAHPSNEFLYIEIDDVDQATGRISPQKLRGSEAPSRARKSVSRGDILVSMVRPDRRVTAIVPTHLDGAVCSTGFAVIRPIRINPGYLFAYLKSDFAVNQFLRRTSTSMYPTISEDDVKQLLVLESKDVEELIGKRVQRAMNLVSDGIAELQGAFDLLSKKSPKS